MALIKCPKCGKMFSEHADKCPACNLAISEFQYYNLKKYNEDRESRLKMESLAKQQEELINKLKAEKAAKDSIANKSNRIYWVLTIALMLIGLSSVLYWNFSNNSYSTQYDFSEYDKPSGSICDDFSESLLWEYVDIIKSYPLPSERKMYCEYGDEAKKSGRKWQIWNEDKILVEIKEYGINDRKTKITIFENYKNTTNSYPNYPYYIYDGECGCEEGSYYIWEGSAYYFKFDNKRHYLSEKRVYRSPDDYQYEQYDINGNVISKSKN